MEAMAGFSLTLDLIGKMFQNASSLKPLGQLKPNCPGIIIWSSSKKFGFFNADPKSKMAATAGHRLTLDPMGKCSNMNNQYNEIWGKCQRDNNPKVKLSEMPSSQKL